MDDKDAIQYAAALASALGPFTRRVQEVAAEMRAAAELAAKSFGTAFASVGADYADAIRYAMLSLTRDRRGLDKHVRDVRRAYLNQTYNRRPAGRGLKKRGG